MMPAGLPSETSPSGPKAGLSFTTDALESAAASLTRAAGKPEIFFQANEGVAKVRCSIPGTVYLIPLRPSLANITRW